jgi:drug/metabolite transporter (DMT)-like permease
MALAAEAGAAQRTVGLTCALLGAVGFAFKSILVKAAYRYGVDAETFLALRMLYALPWLVLMGIAAAHREPQSLSRADLAALALLGLLGYYGSSYLDFLGLKYIAASLERVILFIYPTLVVLYQALQQRRAPSTRLLSALALCYGGVALALIENLKFAGEHLLLGSALVFASAVCFAAYLIGNGRIVGRLGSTRVTAWATGCACVLALLQMLLMRGPVALFQPAWQVQLLALALSIFATVLPIWLIAEAIRRLGAGPTAVIGSLGPVITVALAVLLLGEPLGALQLIGAIAVIAGVHLVSSGPG